MCTDYDMRMPMFNLGFLSLEGSFVNCVVNLQRNHRVNSGKSHTLLRVTNGTLLEHMRM